MFGFIIKRNIITSSSKITLNYVNFNDKFDLNIIEYVMLILPNIKKISLHIRNTREMKSYSL